MIKLTNFLPKISPIASYCLQFLAQSGKFALFILSPHNHAKASIFIILFLASHLALAENKVTAIYAYHDKDQVKISPKLNFVSSEDIKEAIDNGIRIKLIAKSRLFQNIPWWFDKTISSQMIELEISYFNLGKLYTVKNTQSGAQLRFNEYQELWENMENLMVFSYKNSLFLKHKDMRIELRIRLDQGALPIAMQLPVLFNDQWDINTQWYEQKLSIQDE